VELVEALRLLHLTSASRVLRLAVAIAQPESVPVVAPATTIPTPVVEVPIAPLATSVATPAFPVKPESAPLDASAFVTVTCPLTASSVIPPSDEVSQLQDMMKDMKGVWKDKKSELRTLKKAKPERGHASSAESYKDRKARREVERLAFKERKHSVVGELKALKDQWKEMKKLWKKTKKEYKKQAKAASKSCKDKDGKKWKKHSDSHSFDRRAARLARLGKPVRQANFIEELTSVYNPASGTWEAAEGKVAPGCTVRKVWRIRNDGDQAWPEGSQGEKSRLVVVGGRGGAELKLKDNATVFIPAAQPGEVIEVTLELVAPLEPGCYHSIWRMSLNGEKWGPRLWTKVCVIGEARASAAKPKHVMRQALSALLAAGFGDLHQNRFMLRKHDMQVPETIQALRASQQPALTRV